MNLNHHWTAQQLHYISSIRLENWRKSFCFTSLTRVSKTKQKNKLNKRVSVDETRKEERLIREFSKHCRLRWSDTTLRTRKTTGDTIECSLVCVHFSCHANTLQWVRVVYTGRCTSEDGVNIFISVMILCSSAWFNILEATARSRYSLE